MDGARLTDVVGFNDGGHRITAHPRLPCVAFSCGWVALAFCSFCCSIDTSTQSSLIHEGKGRELSVNHVDERASRPAGNFNLFSAFCCFRPAVVVWNWESDSRSVFGTESAPVTCMAFHPDGKPCSTLASCRVVWSLTLPPHFRTLPGGRL